MVWIKRWLTMASVVMAIVSESGAASDQTIDFPQLGDQLTTDTVVLSATASSGLPVTFAVNSGPAFLSIDSTLTFTSTGSVTIVASQAGDENWNPAPDVFNTFNVAKASATVMLDHLQHIFDGTPKTATVTTIPDGLITEITYSGMPTPPTEPGTCEVRATVNDPHYEGFAIEYMVIESLAIPSLLEPALVSLPPYSATRAHVSWSQMQNLNVLVTVAPSFPTGNPEPGTFYAPNDTFGNQTVVRGSTDENMFEVTGLMPGQTNTFAFYAENNGHYSAAAVADAITMGRPQVGNTGGGDPETPEVFLGDTNLLFGCEAWGTLEGNPGRVRMWTKSSAFLAETSSGPWSEFTENNHKTCFSPPTPFNSIGTWYWAIQLDYGHPYGDDFLYNTPAPYWQDASPYNTDFSMLWVNVNPINDPVDPSARRSTSLPESEIDLTWSPNAQNHEVVIVRKPLAASWFDLDFYQGQFLYRGQELEDCTVVYRGPGSSWTDSELEADAVFDYRFHSVNNNFYSTGVVRQASTFSAPPAPIVTAISPDTNAVSLHEGSNQWFEVWADGEDVSYDWRWDGLPVGSNSSVYVHTAAWGSLGPHVLSCFLSTPYRIHSATSQWDVTVLDLPLEIATDSLPPGKVGVPYETVLAATNGVAPYQWLGSLPTVAGWGKSPYGLSTAPANLTNVVDIAAGYRFNLALKSDGTIAAWGDNTYGVCDVPANLTNVVAVEAGNRHGVALLADSTVAAWGTFGERQVPAGLSNVVAISCKSAHTLALLSNGTVVAWGWNYYGQCDVPPALSNVVAIAAGAVHSLALKSNGTVVAWGYNYAGQCDLAPTLSNVVSIAANGYACLALKTDGTVAAWGDQTNVPPNLTNVVEIAAGFEHNLARKSDGSIVAWGENRDGQCNVPSNLPGVVKLSAGSTHSLALCTIPPSFPEGLSCSLDGLVSGTPAQAGTYPLMFTVRDNVGSITSKPLEIVIQPDLPAVPDAPVANAPTDVAATRFTANWEASESATNYLLDVATDPAFTAFVPGFENVPEGETTSRDVTGLSPNQSYYCRVRAENSFGVSDNSSPVGVTTLPAPTDRYVSLAGGNTPPYADWASAAHRIQDAIDAAEPGNTVWVSNGVFEGNVSLNGKSIRVASRFALTGNPEDIETTVIRGTGSGSVVTFTNNETSAAALIGFTVSNGYANGTASSSERGGGILCRSASPRLENLRVVGNRASQVGGGLYFESSQSALRNVLVSGNSAIGGAGVACFSANPSLVNLALRNNAATRVGGGLALDHAAPLLRNLLVVGNTAEESGGGLFLDASSPVVENLTCTGNSALGGGGLHVSFGSHPTLVNSIVWDNAPQQVEFDAHAYFMGITLDHVILQGGTNAVLTHALGPVNDRGGLLDADPLFADSDGRLAPASPGRNSGTNQPWMTAETDLDGQPRIQNDVVDRGACEAGSSGAVAGSLRCTLLPAAACDLGARWRVTSGPHTGWNESGVTLYSIPAGPCTVEFQAVPDWTTPANAQPVITAGVETTLAATYAPGVPDTQPPVIVSVLPVQGHVTRSNVLAMAIAASDDQAVAKVTVNGNEAVSVGPGLWTYDLAGLRGPYNATIVQAVDAAGLATTTNLNYVRADDLQFHAVHAGLWRVRNPWPIAYDLAWQAVETSESGNGSLAPNSDFLFSTSLQVSNVNLFIDGQPFGGAPASPASAPAEPGNETELDSDGDGMSNAAEAFAATDPFSAASVFQLVSPDAGFLRRRNNGQTAFAFAWASSTDNAYAVDTSRNLTNWTVVPDFNGLPGNGAGMAYTNTIADTLYFRLRTWPLSP